MKKYIKIILGFAVATFILLGATAFASDEKLETDTCPLLDEATLDGSSVDNISINSIDGIKL